MQGRGRTQGVWDRLSASFRTYRIINMAKCKPQTNGQDKQDNRQADKQTKTHGQTDERTDRRTDGQAGRTILSVHYKHLTFACDLRTGNPSEDRTAREQ